jgi:hypothetical protein
VIVWDGIPADDSNSAAAVVVAAEDGSFGPFPDGEINRASGAGCEGHDDDLAAFADNPKGAVAAFESELFDVGAGCFGDPQSIQSKERDEGMVAGVAESGGDEHGGDLVTVEAGRVRFVIQTGSSDVHRGRYRDESFLFGVAVEAGDRAQPPRDRGPGTTRASS